MQMFTNVNVSLTVLTAITRGINAIYLKALRHYWQDSASLHSPWPRAFVKSRGEIFMAMVFATTSSVIPRTIRGTSIQSRRGNLVSRGRNFSLPVSNRVPPFELTSKRYRKRVAPFPKESRRAVDVQKISVSW